MISLAEAFHRCWTACVGTPNYDKAVWRAAEAQLLKARPDAKLSPLDAIRERGWSVAVHNDYNLGGVSYTFWLFTKGIYFAKGEAKTDEDALKKVTDQIDVIEREHAI